MKKTIAYTKDSMLHGSKHKLVCCLCGEDNREKLEVEDIGISVGLSGEDYSFCRKCWYNKNLGKYILKLLGYERLKINDENLDIQSI